MTDKVRAARTCTACIYDCPRDYKQDHYVLSHLRNRKDCKGDCPYFPNLHYTDFSQVKED
jgi:flavoprotein